MGQKTAESDAVKPSPPRPKKGKGSALLIRVKQETREALETEANDNGESLSATAERWLDGFRHGLATYEQRVGGVSNAVEVLALAASKIATIKDSTIKLDDWSPEHEREALLAAWRYLIPRALPGTSPSPLRLALIQAQHALSDAANELMASLSQLPPEHPVTVANGQRPNALINFAAALQFDPPSAAIRAVAEGVMAETMRDRFVWALQRLGAAFDAYIDGQALRRDAEAYDTSFSTALTSGWTAAVAVLEAQTALAEAVNSARVKGEQIARSLLPDPSEMDI